MAFTAYLKIDSIPGQSLDAVHRDWIDILAFNHGILQPSSSTAGRGPAAPERCEHQDFAITKFVDRATSRLNLLCCSGQNLNQVTVEICRQNGNLVAPYMTYIFDSCHIKSVSISALNGAGQTELPIEEVTFAYKKVTWNYSVVVDGVPAGNVLSYWDLTANTGG